MEIIKGDIIEAAREGSIDVMLVGCNCFCTWGSGLNKALKEAYPRAYEADCKDYRQPWEKIGSYSYWKSNGLTIINLYTQFDFGTNFRRFEYGAFKRSLDEVCRDFSFGDQIIAFPRIGSGLGGGNKQTIEEILLSYEEFQRARIYEL